MGLVIGAQLFTISAMNVNQPGLDLYDAVRKHNIDQVKKLIKYGAPINFIHPTEIDHWTPLQVASYFGDMNIVEALVKAGADLELRNKDGETALFAAVTRRQGEKGQLEIIKFLVSKGAKVDVVTNNGSTPLSEARKNNLRTVVEFLTQNGAK